MDETVNRWGRILAIGIVLYMAAVGWFLVFGYDGPSSVSDDVYFVPALSGTAIGAFLTLRRPDNRMGPLMTVMAAALVTLGASNALVPWALEHGSDALVVAAVHLSDVAWVTQAVTALVLLPLWFPTGRALTARWAWVGRSAALAGSVALVSLFLEDTVCAWRDSLSDDCIVVQSPWGIGGFSVADPLLQVIFALAVLATVSTFVRWRTSDVTARRQIKWFFVAAVVLLAAFVVAYVDAGVIVNNLAFAVGLTGIWAAIALSVLKYRLYEIDRIVSRTVSYAVVVALLAALFFGLVTAVGSQFESSLAVATSTLAVAALFNPLRRRVQRWVDRHFNRSAYDTEQVMDAFAGSLRDEVDAEEIIDGWVQVVDVTMQPAAVGVWVRA